MTDRVRRPLVSAVAVVALHWLAGCANSPEARAPANEVTTAKSHFARFGTSQVRYVVAGKGSATIVFIHGWSCNAEFWREQVPAFAGHARVICIDLPGHGQSDKPQADYTLDYFARAVLAVMRDARVGKVTLVGHSMGTPIACRVYALAPERVAAIVAVDGLLRRPAVTPEQAEQFIGPFRAPTYREHVAQFVNAMFPNAGTEALRDRVRAEMLMTPQYVMTSAMDGMFGVGQPDWDLKHVTIPLIAIMARNPMWTAEYETYVRGLSPQSQYRVIEGAGHFIAQEKPIEFNAALTESLRQYDLISK